MSITLCAATLVDTVALPAIERSAGQRFLLIPKLAWIAEGRILPVTQHQTFTTTGMSWLAQVNTLPASFLVAETLGSSLFIVELLLHLEQQGKGIDRRPIKYVVEQVHKKGYTSLTLITFRNVTRNAPWYARLGFEILTDEALPAKLRQKREEEAAYELALKSRCAMHLMLR